MTPHYSDPLVTLYLGDCLEVMPTLEAESVDSIVTDPPYGLGFMGKVWDHGVPATPFWAEMLRVAKPGAYLLAFGGTRTVHRIATNIEDAGWEIRDLLMHIYASGFPKSLDVSKALDKWNGRPNEGATIAAAIKEARTSRALSKRECNERFGTTMWGWYENDKRPIPPSTEKFALICGDWPELAPLAESIARAERELVGTDRTRGERGGVPLLASYGEFDITAPATDLARKWEGWGTALKPAHEPIVMARKPLVGTVAANVTRYGTGALNIDGSRIGSGADKDDERWYEWQRGESVMDQASGMYQPGRTPPRPPSTQGRWPSNVLLSDPELFDEPNPWVVGSGATSVTNAGTMRSEANGTEGWGSVQSRQPGTQLSAGDSGGYSRFFIIPKADRAERERGLEPGEKVWSDGRAKVADYPSQRGATTRANSHPTVKPIDLMRHLVRLVTPPGGVCLDPFLGSGTTALAASEEGFRCIGIEREAEYLEIAVGRLMATPMGLGLDVPAGVEQRSRSTGHWPKERTPGKDGWGFSGQKDLEERTA